MRELATYGLLVSNATRSRYGICGDGCDVRPPGSEVADVTGGHAAQQVCAWPAQALGHDVDLLADGLGEAVEDSIVQERGIPRDVQLHVRGGIHGARVLELAARLDVHVAYDVLGHGRDLGECAARVQAHLLLDAYLELGLDIEGIQERGEALGEVDVALVMHGGAFEDRAVPEVAAHRGRGLARLVGPVFHVVLVRPLVHLVVQCVRRHRLVRVVRPRTRVLQVHGAMYLLRGRTVQGRDEENEDFRNGSHRDATAFIYTRNCISWETPFVYLRRARFDDRLEI